MTDKKKCGCGKSKDMPYCDGSHAIKKVLGGVIEQDTTLKLEEKDAPNKPDGLFETQYFTPSIEDIHVGYECEYLHEGGAWLTGFGLESGGFPSLQEIKSRGISIIKVPYLTKEQIEKEGWRTWSGLGDPKRTYPEIWVSKLLERDPTKFVHAYYDFEERILKIEHEVKKSVLFYGECKDINTFRYICKLLGIN